MIRTYLDIIIGIFAITSLSKTALCAVEYYMGYMYYEFCPLETTIPYYLYISGILGMFFTAFLSCSFLVRGMLVKCLPSHGPKTYTITSVVSIEVIISLLCGVWQIIGSVVVFKN